MGEDARAAMPQIPQLAPGTSTTARMWELGAPTTHTQLTTQMSVTLTANYKETLAAETVEKITELIEDSYGEAYGAYDLDDILKFIDENSEEDFVSYYEEYVRCGEAIGYDAVDAYVAEMGCFSYIEGCDEFYQGVYESAADFAEEFVTDCYGEVPSIVVVDWEQTWESALRYDFTACEAGYRNVHIFRDN